MSRDALLERDLLGRRRAQEEFSRPVVLEAGAGTGKTATLVARVLAWSLGAGWIRAAEAEANPSDRSPHDDETIAQRLLGGVVAITFTEAAAAEMGTRLGRELTKIARGDADAVIGFDPELLAGRPDTETMAARAQALLSNLDHLTVRTIHAFCRSLLATYPLESGVHPDFVVDADGSRRRATLREIVEEAVTTSYARDRPDPVTRLASAGVGPDRLFEALDALLQEGADPALFRRDPFDDDGVERLRSSLAEACGELLAAGAGSLRATSARSKRSAETVAAVDLTLAAVRPADGDPVTIELLPALLAEVWNDGLVTRLRAWRARDLNKSEGEVFDGDLERFGDAARALRSVLRSYERIDVERFRDARRAVRELLERADTELRAAGVATFASLLAGAHRLLSENGSVLARERGRIEQLLVDEFQDTDPRQCAIVRQLALEGPEESRPGLFIVGDPKQSIYGWREADLEAYEAFLASIEASGGERHVLTTNFRSTPDVLAEVDRVMRPAMQPEPGLQPRYEPLVPWREGADPEHRDASRFAPPAIEYWVEWTEVEGRGRGSAEQVAALEAEAVARDLERYRAETGTPWRECAILYRGRSKLEELQEALRRRGIPYAVSRDVGYYRRREVIEAAALVRTVLNPTDHLALLTFLRSAAVGAPDAALLPLWQRRTPDLVTQLSGRKGATLDRLCEIAREVAAEVSTEIPGIERIEGWEENLVAAFELIATGRDLFRTLPVDRFLDELRRRSLFEVTEAARYQGEYRLANIERFFRQLEAALGDPRREVESVLHDLRTSIQIQPDAEEAKPQGTEEDSVQLMTIHVAKGLEFRSVWLVQLHARQRSFDRGLSAALFDPRDPVDTPTPAYSLFGWPTPTRHLAEERQERVEYAERVRTLYVAMTRARERLVLSGQWPTGPGPKHWQRAHSSVELLQMRDPAAPDLDELWGELTASGRAGRKIGGVAWKFPALEADDSDVRRAPAKPADASHGLEAEVAEHRRTARGAAARSRRPVHAAASSLHGDLFESGAAGEGPEEREAALLAGTLVHRAFEEWRFDARPEVELARARSRALEEATRADGAVAQRAVLRLEQLFSRLERGELIGRLQGIGQGWLARELPLVAPAPRRSDDDASSDGSPLDALVGSIDLLYRETTANGGRYVIADFKTDLVDDPAQLEARSEAYRPQLDAYREAVAAALPADEPPRSELWFLWPDRVVTLDDGESRTPERA